MLKQSSQVLSSLSSLNRFDEFESIWLIDFERPLKNRFLIFNHVETIISSDIWFSSVESMKLIKVTIRGLFVT